MVANKLMKTFVSVDFCFLSFELPIRFHQIARTISTTDHQRQQVTLTGCTPTGLYRQQVTLTGCTTTDHQRQQVMSTASSTISRARAAVPPQMI